MISQLSYFLYFSDIVGEIVYLCTSSHTISAKAAKIFAHVFDRFIIKFASKRICIKISSMSFECHPYKGVLASVLL